MSLSSVPGSASITVRPMAGHIGAEIGGADLSQPLDDATVAEIRAALLAHKVIFFRDQHIGHAEQIMFGRRFGEVTYAHPYEDDPPEGYPEILPVDQHLFEQRYGVREADRRRSETTSFAGWHTDLTPVVNPPMACILRAETVPEFGGDTTWTNLVAAYDGLSAPLRALADGLRAQHRYLASYQHAPGVDDYRRRIADNPLVTIHPVVRVHPETSEHALFVNPGFTSRIIGLTGTESRRVLELLFEQIIRPAYTVRFRWTRGSVAFWDNRATAHLAPTDMDHLDVRRTMYRIALVGDIPVGVDGRKSEPVAGLPFLASADAPAPGPVSGPRLDPEPYAP